MRSFTLLLSLLMLSLALAAAETITGKIVGSDGQPVTGAILYYNSQGKEVPVQADGHFAFDTDMPPSQPGLFFLNSVAWAPGYTLTRPENDLDRVITLVAGGAISGVVRDAAGGMGAGIPVRLVRVTAGRQVAGMPEPWRDRFTVKSDAGGNWTLPGIPLDGSIVIALDDDRYVHEQQEVRLVPGQTPAPLQFTLRPGATLHGRLLDPEGKPVEEAMVYAGTPGKYSTDTFGTTRTAVDGSYRIAGLSPGSYQISAMATDANWIVDPVRDIRAVEGAETAVPDLRARPGAVVEGTVVDEETGAPLPGATVMFSFGKGPDGQESRMGITADARGHFYYCMTPQPLAVSIMTPPRGYLKIKSVDAIPVELREGKTVTLTLKLKKGLTVTGTVVDQHGNPAAEVPFYINMPAGKGTEWSRDATQVRFTTDAEGRFAADGLPAGNGELHLLTADGRVPIWNMPEPLPIAVPAPAPIAVTLERLTTRAVTGRVVDTQGQLLPAATVTLCIHVEPGGQPEKETSATDENGVYALADIPLGVKVSVLSVQKAGYCRLETGELSTQEGKIDDVVMATCDAVVRGIVRDAEGGPVAGATVVSAEGGLSARALTDDAGAFTLPSQPSTGELHLVAAIRAGAGLATCLGNAADVVIPWKVGRIAKPVDLELAQALLAADQQFPPEGRLFNRDETLRLIADIDFDLASRLALTGNAPASPGLRAYLLGKLAEKDQAAAARDGEVLLDTIEDDDCRLYAAVELGIAVAKADPALAERCYQVAKEIYNRSAHGRKGYKTIEGLGMFGNISLRIVALAGVLDKTTDQDAILAELNAEIKKDEGTGYMIAGPLMEAAGRVNPEFALRIYDNLDYQFKRGELDNALVTMADHDLAGAQRLLDSIYANKEKFIAVRSMGPLRLVRTLAKQDPTAGLALAEKQDWYLRTQAMLQAAVFLPKPEAKLVIADLLALTRNVNINNVVLANAIDSEQGQALYQKHKAALEAESDDFTHVLIVDGSSTHDRVHYAYLIGEIDPVEARLILETEFARVRTRIARGAENFDLQYFPLAMCPLDLDRAEEMLDVYRPQAGEFSAYIQQRIMQYILQTRAERVTELNF